MVPVVVSTSLSSEVNFPGGNLLLVGPVVSVHLQLLVRRATAPVPGQGRPQKR